MFIVLIPTWRCDLAERIGKCPYCPFEVSKEGHHVKFYWGLGTNKVVDHASAGAWNEFISKLEPSYIDICGGEPLFWAELPELVKRLPKGHTWGITSNCVQTEVVKNLDLSRCELWTASFHPYSVGRYDYLDRFFTTLRELRTREIRVVVSIMGYPDNIAWLPFWVEAFEGWGFEVVVQPYENPKYIWGDHPEKLKALECFKKNMNDKKMPIWDTTPGTRYCDGGMNYLMTDPGGAVYRCHLDLVTGKDPIGTIYDDPGFIFKGPALCELACSSSCDRERRGSSKRRVNATG